ncbi:MAG: hypothetical protein ACTHQE_08740 [Thermomicrobiales bacterium]
MTDDTKSAPTPPSPPPDDVDDASSSVVGTTAEQVPAEPSAGRGQSAQGDGNRSRSLYAVLGIGVASLLVLLGIIYFSATKRENPEQPICTAVTTEAAEDAILAGEVHRIVVNYDNQVESPTDAQWGPVLARVDFVDGSCGNLPQGIVAKDEMARILGTAYMYNHVTTETQVEIVLRGTDSLNPSLLVLPTSTPTPTPLVTPTPATPASPIIIVVTATPEPTATPTETPPATPSPEATATPTTATPGPATPDAGTPVPEGTPRPAAGRTGTDVASVSRTPEPTTTTTTTAETTRP